MSLRFAPNQTGKIHLGHVRTCLANYLYAKKHNKKIYLREDFPHNTLKCVVKSHAEDLEWLGFRFDAKYELISVVVPVTHIIHSFLEKKDDKVELLSGETIETNLSQYRWFKLLFPLIYEDYVTFLDSDLVFAFYSFCFDVMFGVDTIIQGRDLQDILPLYLSLHKHLPELREKLNPEYKQWPRFLYLSLVIDEHGRKFDQREGIGVLVESLKEKYSPEAILNWAFHSLVKTEERKRTLDEMVEDFSIEKINYEDVVFRWEDLDRWV